jgi:hypothetical protein
LGKEKMMKREKNEGRKEKRLDEWKMKRKMKRATKCECKQRNKALFASSSMIISSLSVSP